jgi:hypothetical protein
LQWAVLAHFADDAQICNKYARVNSARQGRYVGDKVARKYSNQSLRRADTRLGFYAEVPVFVPNVNQIWNVSTNFSKTLHYQIVSCLLTEKDILIGASQ